MSNKVLAENIVEFILSDKGYMSPVGNPVLKQDILGNSVQISRNICYGVWLMNKPQAIKYIANCIELWPVWYVGKLNYFFGVK